MMQDVFYPGPESLTRKTSCSKVSECTYVGTSGAPLHNLALEGEQYPSANSANSQFLDASFHLYKWECPLDHQPVDP